MECRPLKLLRVPSLFSNNDKSGFNFRWLLGHALMTSFRKVAIPITVKRAWNTWMILDVETASFHALTTKVVLITRVISSISYLVVMVTIVLRQQRVWWFVLVASTTVVKRSRLTDYGWASLDYLVITDLWNNKERQIFSHFVFEAPFWIFVISSFLP